MIARNPHAATRRERTGATIAAATLQPASLEESPMVFGRSMLLVGAGLVAATLSLPAQGDTVQGLATVGTPKVPMTKVSLTNGMAVAYTAPNGQLISVVLCDQPVDAKAFAADTKTGPGEALVPGLFEGAWKAQHLSRKFSGVTFTIGPNGVMSDEILIGGRNKTFSIGGDEYTLVLKSRSPRLVGTLKTKAPTVDLGGDRNAGVDAIFDLAVTTR
jgi:hypothetical protein